jgi:hypothetical protein
VLQVHVYKPTTSKANNSETYVTCKGFRGIDPATLEAMLLKLGTDVHDDASFLPLDSVPPDFLRSVCDCATFFAERTRDSLEDALEKHSHMADAVKWALKDVRRGFAAEWVGKFHQLKPLPQELRLAPVRHVSLSLRARIVCNAGGVH